MKKRTKLTICLGVICALLVAISSWYTIAFNNSRFIVPMDLSEYVFRVQDLPMIISGVLLTLYIVNIVESEIELTITEGRFHQVKRMFEAVGKKVLYLKRISMGPLQLTDDLKPGEYRPLTEEEITALKIVNK